MSPSIALPHCFLTVSCRSGAPVLSWRYRREDIAHSNQVVTCQRQQQLKSNPLLAPKFGFPDRSDRLAPTEDLFDPFASPLTHVITRMTRGAPVNGGTPVGVILSDMRGRLEFAQIVNKIPGVVELVGTDGNPMRAGGHSATISTALSRSAVPVASVSRASMELPL
jgi:hypothetical protein